MVFPVFNSMLNLSSTLLETVLVMLSMEISAVVNMNYFVRHLRKLNAPALHFISILLYSRKFFQE